MVLWQIFLSYLVFLRVLISIVDLVEYKVDFKFLEALRSLNQYLVIAEIS